MASRKMIGSSSGSESSGTVSCPICDKSFEKNVIEDHANKCLFLNTSEKSSSKRNSSHFNTISPNEKRVKMNNKDQIENKLITAKVNRYFFDFSMRLFYVMIATSNIASTAGYCNRCKLRS